MEQKESNKRSRSAWDTNLQLRTKLSLNQRSSSSKKQKPKLSFSQIKPLSKRSRVLHTVTGNALPIDSLTLQGYKACPLVPVMYRKKSS